MGTRAAFFIGNPTNVGDRKYIGAFHWDGFPQEVHDSLGVIESEDDFVSALSAHVKTRDDWVPSEDGFPYPWANNLFLTDYVYAFFDGKLQFTGGYAPWCELNDAGIKKSDEEEYEVRLPEFKDVSAPGEFNGNFDSVLILSG